MHRRRVLLGFAALVVIASCAREHHTPRVSRLPADVRTPAPGEVLVRERFSGTGLPPGGREGVGYFGRNLIVSDGDDQRTIIDLEHHTYTVADKRARVHWTMSLDEMFQRYAALERARREAWEEQRKQRPDLGPYDDAPFTFEATG